MIVQVRCPVCGRRLGDLEGRGEIKCNKCKSTVKFDTERGLVKIVREDVNRKTVEGTT